MDLRGTDVAKEEKEAGTPEDGAVLYSWANLHGAKYRDFSLSGREYRAQMRCHAAEQQREAELKASAEVEAVAAAAEATVREVEEAARRAETALAETDALGAEREMAETHVSAQRHVESEARRRVQAGPQPGTQVPGAISYPCTPESQQPTQVEHLYHHPHLPAGSAELDPTCYRSSQEHRAVQDTEETIKRWPQASSTSEMEHPTAEARQDEMDLTDVPLRERPAECDRSVQEPTCPGASTSRPPAGIPEDLLERMGSIRLPEAPLRQMPSARSREMWPAAPVAQEPRSPAWLYVQQEQDENCALQGESSPHDFRSRQEMSRSMQKVASPSPVADILQPSRERMAARWFVLKGVFEHAGQGAQPEAPPARQQELRAPMLAVFSLAGGVGKTSLVATLGCALSSLGEKVLLTDTNSHSLLPFYFGASEQRPDVVRTFLPPSGSMDAPIYLLNYDVDQKGGDQETQDWLAEDLTRNSHGMQRILLDLTGGSGWVARRMARMSSTVLVPVAPDMNSVISLQVVEKFFAGVTDADGQQVQPYYVLNQFDAELPLHLDVREVLGLQLGERLLPFAIRRAPLVSEALAEGMTVMDYAPDAAVSDDYRNIASWLRAISVPVTTGLRNLRWSER